MKKSILTLGIAAVLTGVPEETIRNTVRLAGFEDLAQAEAAQ